MITFLISGIWHGAALTFVVWGLMQGVFLSMEALTNQKRTIFEKKFNMSNRLWYVFAGICLTFVLFAASQIFGRATDIKDAFDIYGKIFSAKGLPYIGSPTVFIITMVGLFMLLCKDFTEEYMPERFLLFENKHKLVRVIAYWSTFILILLIGVFSGSQFIYFQF
jgi:D-alanyl-lipoteichoic acid acyltransferase DltB (MBOAT superfamily)